ncbi:hypothetical protein J6590_030422 [Homalodisca vitripennis]|nr:hypothetical protein J6590_030422 [Homalodisca vitripennis]
MINYCKDNYYNPIEVDPLIAEDKAFRGSVGGRDRSLAVVFIDGAYQRVLAELWVPESATCRHSVVTVLCHHGAYQRVLAELWVPESATCRHSVVTRVLGELWVPESAPSQTLRRHYTMSSWCLPACARRALGAGVGYLQTLRRHCTMSSWCLLACARRALGAGVGSLADTPSSLYYVIMVPTSVCSQSFGCRSRLPRRHSVVTILCHHGAYQRVLAELWVPESAPSQTLRRHYTMSSWCLPACARRALGAGVGSRRHSVVTILCHHGAYQRVLAELWVPESAPSQTLRRHYTMSSWCLLACARRALGAGVGSLADTPSSLYYVIMVPTSVCSQSFGCRSRLLEDIPSSLYYFTMVPTSVCSQSFGCRSRLPRRHSVVTILCHHGAYQRVLAELWVPESAPSQTLRRHYTMSSWCLPACARRALGAGVGSLADTPSSLYYVIMVPTSVCSQSFGYRSRLLTDTPSSLYYVIMVPTSVCSESFGCRSQLPRRHSVVTALCHHGAYQSVLAELFKFKKPLFI